MHHFKRVLKLLNNKIDNHGKVRLIGLLEYTNCSISIYCNVEEEKIPSL